MPADEQFVAPPEGNTCAKLWFSSTNTNTWLELGKLETVVVTFTAEFANLVESAMLVAVTVCIPVVAGAV
jgi:hypothetical protein